MPALDKSLKTLNALYAFVDIPTGGASSTVATAATAGATSLVLAAASTFANNDDIRIGTGETMELAKVSSGGGTTTLTLAKPLKYDHAIGEAVVEQHALDLAQPEAEGFTLGVATETTDIFTATQRLTYATLNGYTDLSARWSYPVVTTDVMALALGIPTTNVIGNGTAAAQTGTAGPRLVTTDGSLFGAIINVNLVALGQLQDNTYVRIELYNLTFDPGAFAPSFSRGQLTRVNVRASASGGVIDTTGTVWAPNTIFSTYVASKSDVFAEITQVSDLQASGTTNTLSAGAAAGAYAVTLTSATGFVANDIIQVGTGDTAEVHIVHAVATNTLNLRTQLLRAFASGVTVTKLNKVAIAGVTGGFNIVVNAQTSQNRIETSRVSLGLKLGSVSMALQFQLNALSPENFQLMFGLPAAAIVSNQLQLTNRIGTLASKHLMFEGNTAGGKKLTIIGWNSSVEATGEITFTQAQLAQGPVSVKPNGLQILVNA